MRTTADRRFTMAIVVVVLVVLAGCLGGLLGGERSSPTPTETAVDSSAVQSSPSRTPTSPATPTSTPTATEDGPTVPATQEPRNLSVTNYRYEEVVVTVRAVRGPVEKLNVTYGNGSVRTDARKEYDVDVGWPFGPWLGRNVTSVEPVDTTAVARWSADVSRNETVSLPTVATHPHVSYLVVVYHPFFEQVVDGRLVECTPPFSRVERFELQMGEPGTRSAGARGHVSCHA